MPIPASHDGVHYSKFLAEIVQQREAVKYLEIGVQAGHNLTGISVDTAIGIDPAFALAVDATIGKKNLHLHRMSSDAFFARHAVSGIDVVFLDGMHLCEFLLRDFYNVEAASKRNGLIFMHDCLPYSADLIDRIDTRGGPWTGDVWKTVAVLEKHRPDLKILAIDCAPTGLVAITNLDPSSTSLCNAYGDLAAEMHAMPNDAAGLSTFYQGRLIVSSSEILSDFNQSRFFKT